MIKSQIANKISKKNVESCPWHYFNNHDVDRFNFVLSQEIENMEQYRKNYSLDWNEIIEEYLEVGIGDVPHFASQYVFAKALNTRRTSERNEMQTMYLDIVDGINKLIKMGDLPISLLK